MVLTPVTTIQRLDRLTDNLVCYVYELVLSQECDASVLITMNDLAPVPNDASQFQARFRGNNLKLQGSPLSFTESHKGHADHCNGFSAGQLSSPGLKTPPSPHAASCSRCIVGYSDEGRSSAEGQQATVACESAPNPWRARWSVWHGQRPAHYSSKKSDFEASVRGMTVGLPAEFPKASPSSQRRRHDSWPAPALH